MEERRFRSGNNLRITWNIQTERTQTLLETRHVLDRPQPQDRQTHRGFFPAPNLSLYEKSLDKSVGIAYVSIAKLWHYELLCITEVLGYVLAGPIGNQVLVARWFQARRGRAMGYVYLGLGLGGVISPLLSNFLIRNFGWRHALEFIGSLVMIVLIPVAIFVTRSVPADLGLSPDGATDGHGSPAIAEYGNSSLWPVDVQSAIRTTNFWLILAGSTVVIGAIGAVIPHFILFF